ncbi:uncharacterized protein [Watersipora subatra]|uniref:uncharacterized protein n=1 Tax=Watersipora subatra TaxID=2589382 RepID=UPI00355B2513
MVIGYTVTTTWDYGDVMCRVVAHFLLSTSIATCLSILALNLDRVFAIANPERYAHQMSLWKTTFLILLVWIVAVLFPLPLSTGSVPTRAFGNRYICSIEAGSDINYLISLYSICFALPALVNVLFFIYIAREALSEKEAESMGTSRESSAMYKLWPEVQSAGVVFILYLTWAVSELPYITLSSIEQYIHSAQVNGQFEYAANLDTAFVWLKFCDCGLLPFVIFKWRKDIWQKFKDLLFCRKNNSVLDSSPRVKDRNNNGRNKGRSPPVPVKADTPKFQASFPIPTLTATKDGLHVHGNPDEDPEDFETFYADMDITTKTDYERIRTAAVVEQYYDEASQMRGTCGEETSDYETDPYSQSDPISVRSAGSNLPTRSLERQPKTHSHAHDSGNSSTSGSVKKRKKKRAVASVCIDDSPNQAPSEPHLGGSGDKRVEESSISQAHQPVTDSIAPDIENNADLKVKPQKKKRKKKRQNVLDAETNTSQVFNGEMLERKARPPRLEPLGSEISPYSVATPPLRSKFPKEPSSEDTFSSSSAFVDKRQIVSSQDDLNITKEPNQQTRRKKVKPRNRSNDAVTPLSAPTTSSTLSILETQM